MLDASDPLLDDEVQPAPPLSMGAQIDRLVAEIPKLQTASEEAETEHNKARGRHRRALVELVELVDRPMAAKLLGMTPRELAGKLR